MRNFTTTLLLLLATILGFSSAKGAETNYDYEFTASVLCQADWYGSRRSDGNHQLNNYYLVQGNKELAEDGTPSASSTVYALDFFGAAPDDQRNPQPPVGTYTFSSTLGNNVLYNDIHVYQVDGNGNYEIDRGFKAGTLEISTYEKDGNAYYKYEAVLTDEIGKTHHVTYESRFITYNDLSQGSLELEKDLDFKCINAYAKYRSVSDGVMNVFLELSDMPKDDEGNYSYADLPGNQMMIELYLPFVKTLANGTYTPSDDAGDAFTMETGEIVNYASVQYAVGSYVQYVFTGQQIAWGCVKSGTLTISGEGSQKTIVGDFMTDYGYSIKFTYEGEIPIDKIPETGITGDITLDLEGATAQFECVGDRERLNNCRNWYITILPAEGKDHGFISYINTRNENFYDGIASETYTASPSKVPWKGEYLKGSKNEKGQLRGTWALTSFDESGQPQVNAPAQSGDLNITQHEDGQTYTLDFNLNDGLGHNFKGSWTGKPELINSCGDETGINDVTSVNGKHIEGIYDLNGRKADGKAKGAYIIRYSDGTAAKKIVK